MQIYSLFYAKNNLRLIKDYKKAACFAADGSVRSNTFVIRI